MLYSGVFVVLFSKKCAVHFPSNSIYAHDGLCEVNSTIRHTRFIDADISDEQALTSEKSI